MVSTAEFFYCLHNLHPSIETSPVSINVSSTKASTTINITSLLSMQRVLYPRSHLHVAQKNPVVGGTPITEEQAITLRQVVFGSAAIPQRNEWTRTGFCFRESDQEFAYGLKVAKNGTKALVMALQAYIIKNLLFEKRSKDQGTPSEVLLRPSRYRQLEALWLSISDIIWKAGELTRCCVCLPQDACYVEQSQEYFHDGVTEKLHLFEFTNLEDLQIFIKRYIYLFQQDPGPGALLLLYSAVLSRGVAKVKTDLDDEKACLMTVAEEGSHCLVTLALTGRATPYLHNGVIYVGDENTYALPKFGVLLRSEIGFLLCDEILDKSELTRPGSRLKTPSLPVWVSCCRGHYGVLFNTNRDLLRDYHAEHRFNLFYYNSASFQGGQTLLSIDTRFNDGKDKEDFSSPPLERLIHTKWEDARINWNGSNPYA